jgi:predicted acyl esterase
VDRGPGAGHESNRLIRDDTNALVGDRVLPLTDFPVFNIKPVSAGGSQLTHELAPYFLDWLAHPTYDSYWKQWSIEENYQNIQVPALTIAAWYTWPLQRARD